MHRYFLCKLHLNSVIGKFDYTIGEKFLCGMEENDTHVRRSCEYETYMEGHMGHSRLWTRDNIPPKLTDNNSRAGLTNDCVDRTNESVHLCHADIGRPRR